MDGFTANISRIATNSWMKLNSGHNIQIANHESKNIVKIRLKEVLFSFNSNMHCQLQQRSGITHQIRVKIKADFYKSHSHAEKPLADFMSQYDAGSI